MTDESRAFVVVDSRGRRAEDRGCVRASGGANDARARVMIDRDERGA